MLGDQGCVGLGIGDGRAVQAQVWCGRCCGATGFGFGQGTQGGSTPSARPASRLTGDVQHLAKLPLMTTTAPAPKKKLPLWQKLLIGVGVLFVALVILGLVIGPDKKADTAAPAATTPSSTLSTTTSTASVSSTSAPAPSAASVPAAAPVPEVTSTAPVVSADQQVAAAAETYVKENWGMSPDASWQSFQCTAGMTCWQPYVVRFEFSSGVLRPTLQIDGGGQKALGQKAAQNMASFIGFSKEPWAQQIDWVEVVDGAGVHVAQESVTRR